MAVREFLDFVDASGRNVIKEWLNGLTPPKVQKQVKAKLDLRLAYLRAAPEIRDDYMEKLQGQCDSLYEMKMLVANIQFRPLVCHGPGPHQMTILFPATEHNGRLQPPNACRSALQRAAVIDQQGRVTPHDY